MLKIIANRIFQDLLPTSGQGGFTTVRFLAYLSTQKWRGVCVDREGKDRLSIISQGFTLAHQKGLITLIVFEAFGIDNSLK